MDRKHISKRLIIWYSLLWILLIVALYLAYGVYFVDTTSTKSKWVGLFAGAIAVLLSACKVMEMSFYKSKNKIHEKITQYFLNGSFVFIKRLFKISSFFAFLISCLLIKPMGVPFVVCFLIGSLFTFLMIFLNTVISAKIATRSSQFYNESNLLAFKQMFNSGVAISFITCSFLIIPLVILFHITKDYQIINAFVFGAALVVIINNVSIVITRQAVKCANDVVNDNVVEFEDNDRRNPLLLLLGVSKSILGVNILTGDLFVSFALALVSAMAIGGTFYQLMGAFLPIIIAASGIFVCVVTVLLTKIKTLNNLIKKMLFSAFFANLLFVFVSYYLVKQWFSGMIELIFPIILGAFAGFILCFSYYNLITKKTNSIINISNASVFGFIAVLRQIIKESFTGVFLPVVIITLCFIFSFVLAQGINEPSAGLYGVSLSILSMFSCVGILIGISCFGMASKNVCVVLDTYGEDICDKKSVLVNELSDISYQLICLCKNFLNSASILTAIVALMAYTILSNLEQIDIMNPYVLAALLMGATIPFVFGTFIVGSVSKTAKKLAFEVKKQIRNIPQILRYEIRPNYEKCCEVAVFNSILQVIFSLCLIISIFWAIVKFLKTEALMGFVFGVMLSSIVMLYATSTTSILGKSAKKYFKDQFECIKSSQEYSAISLNETMFDLFKDLINPSLNILIKFLAILALVLAPMFM